MNSQTPWAAPRSDERRPVRIVRQPRVGLGLHEHIFAFEVGASTLDELIVETKRFFASSSGRDVSDTATAEGLVELERGAPSVRIALDERRIRHWVAVYFAPVSDRGFAVRCRFWMIAFAIYAPPFPFEADAQALFARLDRMAPNASPISAEAANDAWQRQWAGREYSVLSAMPSALPRPVGVVLLILALPLLAIGVLASAAVIVDFSIGDRAAISSNAIGAALFLFFAWPLVYQGMRSLLGKPRSAGVSAWLVLALSSVASVAFVAFELWRWFRA